MKLTKILRTIAVITGIRKDGRQGWVKVSELKAAGLSQLEIKVLRTRGYVVRFGCVVQLTALGREVGGLPAARF